jgi:hypothetical protein
LARFLPIDLAEGISFRAFYYSAIPISLLQSRGEYIDFAIRGIHRNMQITAGDKIRNRTCLGTLSQESFGNELQGALFRNYGEINRSEQEPLCSCFFFVNSNVCMKEYSNISQSKRIITG